MKNKNKEHGSKIHKLMSYLQHILCDKIEKWR
jgi:hypothetical protein